MQPPADANDTDVDVKREVVLYSGRQAVLQVHSIQPQGTPGAHIHSNIPVIGSRVMVEIPKPPTGGNIPSPQRHNSDEELNI